MGSYLDAGDVGKWFALLLLSLPAALALLKSFKAPAKALRLGCLSLFCGLAMLVWPETVIESLTLGISAWARLGLGLGGVATAILALVRSRQEEGGRAAPWWGGALSALHLVMAVGLLFLSDRLSAPPPGETWEYRSLEEDFAITLPSKEWRQTRDANGILLFFNDRQLMRAISWGRPGTEESWKAEIQKSAESARSLESRSVEEGGTPDGHSFHLTTGLEVSKDRVLYVAVSHVWIPSRKRMVATFFEGMKGMKSQAAMKAEERMLKESARSICLSVR